MVIIGGKRKFTIEEIREYIKNLEFELISKEYINSKIKLIYKDKDGYFYYSKLDSLKLNKVADKFNKSNPYTIQNIKLWCKLENKPFELISNEYIGSNIKLKWQCLNLKCGEIFKASCKDIIGDHGCGICVGHQVGLINSLAVKNSKLAKEWHPTKNGDLTPYDVRNGSRKEVWWLCPKCGYEWKAEIINRSRTKGTNCPECSDSKGESKINETLIKYNIFNSMQYKFEDCKDKRQLAFDSAVFTNNKKNILKILIEYDGQQHFKPVNFGGISYEKAVENLEKTKYRDSIKNNYCIKNNIPLLRIPYWEFDNIEEILVDILINKNMNNKYILNNNYKE